VICGRAQIEKLIAESLDLEAAGKLAAESFRQRMLFGRSELRAVEGEGGAVTVTDLWGALVAETSRATWDAFVEAEAAAAKKAGPS
jgi:hypothetical protein